MISPLKKYHQRRYVISGAVAIIKASGLLTKKNQLSFDIIAVELVEENWLQYRKEKEKTLNERPNSESKNLQ